MDRPQFFKSKDEIPQNTKTIDLVPSMLEELFAIRNPHFKRNPEGREEAWKV